LCPSRIESDALIDSSLQIMDPLKKFKSRCLFYILRQLSQSTTPRH
jgi:hypothetical protein